MKQNKTKSPAALHQHDACYKIYLCFRIIYEYLLKTWKCLDYLTCVLTIKKMQDMCVYIHELCF